MNTSSSTVVHTSTLRKTALIAGVLYLVTIVASIPTLALKGPVRDHVNFILGAGSSHGVVWAAVLDIITALAGVGTAVVLFPVVRRHGELAARAFITSRVIEAAMLFVGVVSLLAVVTLRHDLAGTTGTNAATLVIVGRALVAVHNWTFLLGPGFMPAVNALCLATVLYRSRLVPRIIPILGLIGAPLLLASALGTIFGLQNQISSSATLLALPVALWELSLGIWLTFKGFTTEPKTTAAPASDTVPYATVAA